MRSGSIWGDGFSTNHGGYRQVGGGAVPPNVEGERSRYSSEYSTSLLAEIQRAAPRVPFDVFLSEVLVWKQPQFEGDEGEHFAMVGPTGQGKTTMLHALLPQRNFVTIFATKPRDLSMDRLITDHGFIRLDRWKSLDPEQFPRRIIWPNALGLDAEDLQRSVFEDAFQNIYREGEWTLALDEMMYLADDLGLKKMIKRFLTQSRALGISLVAATQRPRYVPLETYDQSTHLMFWRDNDEENLKRLGSITFRDKRLVQAIVANLDRYQALYINTRTGRMVRTRAPFTDERG